MNDLEKRLTDRFHERAMTVRCRADVEGVRNGTRAVTLTVTDPPPPRRAWVVRVACAGVAAGLIGGLATVIVTRSTGSGSGPAVSAVAGPATRSGAWATELVAFAQRSPLMLLNDARWTVVYADERDGVGEMKFTDGARYAELMWRPGSLSDWLDDRLDGGTRRGRHDIVNGTATIVQYSGGNGDYTALWEVDGRVLEFRTQTPTLNEFTKVLDTLVIVDIDAWLAAMPASVIGTADQPHVIAEMLTGIPLPPGFDPGRLGDDARIKDRYQLGARVVGAVSCAWIEQWLDATAVGDTAAAQQATDAMDTAKQWPIIREMNQSGDYGRVLQQLIDAMHTDGQVLPPHGPALGDNYRNALGC